MDIDFVVLWVDGSDPIWQVEKAKYQGKTLDDSNSENRFRDWGLMPYWFRAVEQFAPWVRKIHFVTCGHVPEFLNLAHPKLHHVKHAEFLPAEVLPTFSSHAIEMNLHRIPDLAEHFVYFNDDMFLLRPVSETAFFKEGLPCTYGGESPIELVGEIGIWQHAAVNDLGVINAHFNKREQVKQYGKTRTAPTAGRTIFAQELRKSCSPITLPALEICMLRRHIGSVHLRRFGTRNRSCWHAQRRTVFAVRRM